MWGPAGQKAASRASTSRMEASATVTRPASGDAAPRCVQRRPCCRRPADAPSASLTAVGDAPLGELELLDLEADLPALLGEGLHGPLVVLLQLLEALVRVFLRGAIGQGPGARARRTTRAHGTIALGGFTTRGAGRREYRLSTRYVYTCTCTQVHALMHEDAARALHGREAAAPSCPRVYGPEREACAAVPSDPSHLVFVVDRSSPTTPTALSLMTLGHGRNFVELWVSRAPLTDGDICVRHYGEHAGNAYENAACCLASWRVGWRRKGVATVTALSWPMRRS